MSDAFQPLVQPTTTRTEFPTTQNPEQKGQEAFHLANEVYRRNPDWVTFFREVLGVEGVIRKMFPHPQELLQFEQSEQYREIQQMLAQLRDRSKHPNEKNEPTRVITVRLPKSLHEALRHEAHERKTSMNQLCISKLLQIIDNELVPRD
jgi:predicted HicB family RNase H-like nuclease